MGKFLAIEGALNEARPSGPAQSAAAGLAAPLRSNWMMINQGADLVRGLFRLLDFFIMESFFIKGLSDVDTPV